MPKSKTRQLLKRKPKSASLANFKLEYEDLPSKPKSKKSKPFLLADDDPGDFWGKDLPKPRKQFNRSKSKKVLTIPKPSGIIEFVNKAKRKDDKMAADKTKKANGNKANMVKSAAWLVEAAFRAFAGWVLLTNFEHFATTAAAFYALGTAALIVVIHFFKANK